MLADLTIQSPNRGFMNKFSLVVEVRLIKGKINHPPIFKKIRYFSYPDRVFRLGSQKYYSTRGLLCKKMAEKCWSNFKTILKEERWSKLPAFTVFSRRKSEAAMGRSGGQCILGCRIAYKQCCWSGSGIRNPVPFWPLDPGSRKGFFQIPDLGSQIPNQYFWELSDNFLGEKSYNSWKLAQIFFFSISKRK
jgi:hypothetical protein